MITPKNVLKHELIGFNVEITKSKNSSLVGLKGKIVDETKNMFIIKTEKKEMRITKKENIFRINIGGEKVEIEGSMLVAQSEKRIKKTFEKKRV